MPTNLYALILAGGLGSRLWPRSRTHHPKQFLDLTGDLTMLQQAQARLTPLVRPENTYVATGEAYIDTVAKQLPTLPPVNIIGEPIGRGTAAAIGLAAHHIRARDPEAVMAVVTADHLIKKKDVFRRALEAAGHVAAEGWLVTLGIKPEYPETGYGYIERGEFLGMVGEFEGFEARHFIEKPDLERARKYVENGGYDWNSGMFIWEVARILDEMEAHLPELAEGLNAIGSHIGKATYQSRLEEVFPLLPNVTIDYGIMEKAAKVAVLPIEIGWNDVGSWSALFDVLPKDPDNNAVVGSHIGADTKNSLIVTHGRLIATIGLDEIVIIDTEDVLLVCRRDRTQDVRKIVEMLRKNGDAGYLEGRQTAQPLTLAEIRGVFSAADPPERVLVSLLLHAGMWPSQIAGMQSADVDLILGWVKTPDGRRPLPDRTRRLIFEWMQTQDSLQFNLGQIWTDSQSVAAAVKKIGDRSGVRLSVDRLYETLARSIYAGSEEGQLMRSALGEQTDLVRVPLQALFPFSLADFSGNETSPVGERAHRVLNRAADQLF